MRIRRRLLRGRLLLLRLRVGRAEGRLRAFYRRLGGLLPRGGLALLLEAGARCPRGGRRLAAVGRLAAGGGLRRCEVLRLPAVGLPRGIFLGFDGGGFAAAVAGRGGWLRSAVGSGSTAFLLCEVCARTSRYASAAERAVSARRLPRELGGGFFRTLAITLAAWEALDGLLVRVWASLAPAIVSPLSAAEAPLLRGIAAPAGRVVQEALPR